MTVEITDPIEGPPLIDYIAENLPVSKVATMTVAAMDFWVDPINGDDSNSGLIQTEPIQTLERLDDLIPTFIDHRVWVHLASGDHVLPARGWWLSSRVVRKGWLRIFADEAWDPAVYNVVVANGTAEAGTDATAIAYAAAGTGTYFTMTLEMTSGAAIGFRQHVTIADAAGFIKPVLGFDANLTGLTTPVAGDTFRIFQTDGCRLVAPATLPNGSSRPLYQLTQRIHGLEGDLYDIERPLNEANEPFGRFILEGVQLAVTDGTNSYDSFHISASNLCVYGLHDDESNNARGEFIHLGNTHFVMGCGAGVWIDAANASIYSPYRGWGYSTRRRGPRPQKGAVVEGYYVQNTSITWDMHCGDDGAFILYGGWPGRFSTPEGHRHKIIYMRDLFAFFGNRTKTDLGALSFLQWDLPGRGRQGMGELNFIDATMGDAIIVEGLDNTLLIRGGGETRLARQTSGQTIIHANNGGAVMLRGAPTDLTRSAVGVPVLDWSVDGVAFDPLVELASEGSFVTRESLGGAPGLSKIIRVYE